MMKFSTAGKLRIVPMAGLLRNAPRKMAKAASAQFFRHALRAGGHAALAVAACLSSGSQNIGHAKAADAESKPPVTVCESGAAIAAQGTARAPACAGCHAFDGSADGTGAFPRITGLPAEYIEAQMRDFASGVRDNAIMSPIAKDLSPAESNCAAAYYAGAKVPFPPLKSGDPALIKLGEQLATAGDVAKGIPGCDACHGPQGNGQPGIAPYLGGQYGHYIEFTLHMWQRGYRKNSPGLMETFAKNLNDQEIDAVAAYYQQAPASAAAAAQK
jgi:cytochrome c553